MPVADAADLHTRHHPNPLGGPPCQDRTKGSSPSW